MAPPIPGVLGESCESGAGVGVQGPILGGCGWSSLLEARGKMGTHPGRGEATPV